VPLHAVTRSQANDEEVARAVRDATGVFLTGGNQLRLSSAVAGTRLADAIHRANDRGAVLAGTSAGASAMAAHMMAFGREGESPKNRMAQLAAGLGVLTGVVIDQHFSQRGRFGRLLSVVAHSPSLVGIGLDEDTCAVVYTDRLLEVIGRGAVTIVDGSRIATDVHRAKGYRPLMVSGAIVHSLPEGTWFDLRARRLVSDPPGAEREASE
jgi:cyanophycinase